MAFAINIQRTTRLIAFCNNIRFKSCSGKGKSLVGRDLIDLNEYSEKEIQDLIWTAMDMKCTASKEGLRLLKGKSITMLLKRPCIKTQIVVPTAVELLGGKCNVFIDDCWEEGKNVEDVGRFLSCQSDLIFCLGDDQKKTCELANGSNVPVVSILSDTYTPFKCLVDLLTVTEHFGKLKKLSMGYVGPPGPLFKTYLTTLPRLKMDFRFNHGCLEVDAKTCKLKELAMKYSKHNKTEMKETLTHEEALYRAHIVATVYHQESNIRISSEELKAADVNWMFLHSLPRSTIEVSNNVFNHERSRVWHAVANTKWMAMAVVLRLLKDFQPLIDRPDFDQDKDYSRC